MTVRIGPAGWSYEDWAGVVYPKPRPRGFSELAFLARYFDAFEINTSFYRPLRPELSKTWFRKIGAADLKFTAKLWQKFTHDAEPFEGRDVDAVRVGIEPLRQAGLLAAMLVQFPWSYAASGENRGRIGRIREAFPDVPLVVELRHASWDAPETLEFLSKLNMGFCNIDQPSSRGSISNTAYATSRIAYVRLHGRNRAAWFNAKSSVAEKYDYLYCEEELKPWVDKIRELESKSEQVFVIANNHFQGKAIANALQLKAMLSGKPVEAPETLMKVYKDLEKFVSTRARQPDLF